MGAAENRSADHHVIAGPDVAPGADISDSGRRVPIKIVHLDESCASAGAFHDCRVLAGREGDDHRGFGVALWSNTAGLDVAGLVTRDDSPDLSRAPVVVECNRRSARIPKGEAR